jgi:CubicO group peptidase (beta-lactamase class C family)
MDVDGARTRLIVVVALVGSAGWARGTPAERGDAQSNSGPLPAPTRAKVQEAIRQFQNTNHTPGVLVGIWSPRGTFVSATGVADLATGLPLSTDMQFKMGSQTKAFTANLILQLVGEGKSAPRSRHPNRPHPHARRGHVRQTGHDPLRRRQATMTTVHVVFAAVLERHPGTSTSP